MKIRLLAFVPCLLLASCGDAPVPSEEAPAPDVVAPEGSEAGALVVYSEEREACTDRNPERNAYFGDLHIHTGLSFDANPWGTQAMPVDVYQFAQGEAISIPPYEEGLPPKHFAQLARPLDFAAVTDHSEFLGERVLCNDETSPGYNAEACILYRKGGMMALLAVVTTLVKSDPQPDPEICGPDNARCIEAIKPAWSMIQQAAENAYDRSFDCSFTTFVGYEHTGTPDNTNYHRNVIFRNAVVPDYPTSYIESPKDHQLWAFLSQNCLDREGGCDVITIPHNTNTSTGALLTPLSLPLGEALDYAKTRHHFEPIMEIFQHKGSSECVNGLPGIVGEPDELCDVEQLRVLGKKMSWMGIESEITWCEEGEVGKYGLLGGGCTSRNDFQRTALLTGLQEEARLGVNPLKFGVIGSTDTHLGLAGDVDETDWQGHTPDETDINFRMTEFFVPHAIKGNPGGLAGVWAIENSRDALFDAMRRREVFGTSGPRIKPRFFGGANFTSDICNAPDLVTQAFEQGVPMGSDLVVEDGTTPSFVLTALKDTLEGANGLEKIQIIKGWISQSGEPHYKVFDVATQAQGADQLCGTFTDAEFDASLPSYFYMRAVETESYR